MTVEAASDFQLPANAKLDVLLQEIRKEALRIEEDASVNPLLGFHIQPGHPFFIRGFTVGFGVDFNLVHYTNIVSYKRHFCNL